jgi:hypothetical protein
MKYYFADCQVCTIETIIANNPNIRTFDRYSSLAIDSPIVIAMKSQFGLTIVMLGHNNNNNSNTFE